MNITRGGCRALHSNWGRGAIGYTMGVSSVEISRWNYVSWGLHNGQRSELMNVFSLDRRNVWLPGGSILSATWRSIAEDHPWKDVET